MTQKHGAFLHVKTQRVLAGFAVMFIAAIFSFTLLGCNMDTNGGGGEKTLSNIGVKTQLAKTAYTVGNTADYAGLVIIATYSDGSTEDITYAASNTDFSFTGFNSAFVAISQTITITYKLKTATFTISITSTDPLQNWTVVNPGLTIFYSDIAYGNGKFVAVGGDGYDSKASKIAYSMDGITWVEVSDPIFSDEDGSSWSGLRTIAYGNGTFVVGDGDHIYTSTNGATWTSVSIKSISDMTGSFSFSSGIVYDGAKWVVGGWNDYVPNSPNNKPVILTSSDNGTTWMKAADAPLEILDIAYGGGKFVAVGNNATIAASSDNGTTLTRVFDRDVDDDYYYNASFDYITYGTGKFVVVGRHLGELIIIISGTLE